MSVPVPSTPTNPADDLRKQIALAIAGDTPDAKHFLDDADAALTVVAPVLKGLRAEVERLTAALDRVHENLARIDDGRTGIWASDMRAFLTGVGLGPSTADHDDANLLANPQAVSDQTPATPDGSGEWCNCQSANTWHPAGDTADCAPSSVQGDTTPKEA